MSTNTTIVGNLTRAPELRFTASGKAVTTIGVAVNTLLSKPGEERREETSFFDVVCWESLAENVADLPVGARIICVGRLKQRSWETEDGGKRSRVELVAQEVGPSLRWASAEVTKNERPEHATVGGGDAPSGYDPAEEPF